MQVTVGVYSEMLVMSAASSDKLVWQRLKCFMLWMEVFRQCCQLKQEYCAEVSLVVVQTFVSRTRLAVQKAEDMTATTFEEDNISVLPSDQGQAPSEPHNACHALLRLPCCPFVCTEALVSRCCCRRRHSVRYMCMLQHCTPHRHAVSIHYSEHGVYVCLALHS